MVLNVFKSEFLENPGVSVHEIENIVAKKTDVSARTVFSIRKEYKESHTLSAEPRKPTEYKKISHTMDDFDRYAIKRRVHQFFFDELPTIDKVLKEVNDDPDLTSFERTTFYKLPKLLNFELITKYRNEGREMYYLDETWINAGHTKSKVWIDTPTASSRQAFLHRLSTGLKNPSGMYNLFY
nr:unnamed protein product [Callosobruchus analis]